MQSTLPLVTTRSLRRTSETMGMSCRSFMSGCRRSVDWAFWGVLGATVVTGAVELPVAAVVAGGVVIARHVRR
jgi:hypothetical protein